MGEKGDNVTTIKIFIYTGTFVCCDDCRRETDLPVTMALNAFRTAFTDLLASLLNDALCENDIEDMSPKSSAPVPVPGGAGPEVVRSSL